MSYVITVCRYGFLQLLLLELQTRRRLAFMDGLLLLKQFTIASVQKSLTKTSIECFQILNKFTFRKVNVFGTKVSSTEEHSSGRVLRGVMYYCKYIKQYFIG